MGPLDYSFRGPDPSQMLMQGLGQGLQINQLQQQRAAQEAERAAAQRLNTELEAASRDPRMIPGLMVRYPQLAEKFKVGLDAMNADQQRGVLQNNTELASALASGKPEFAIQRLEQRQNLLREQGDKKGAEALGQMIEDVRADPDAMLTFTLGRINALPGGDKVSEGVLKLFDERRKAAKAPAEQRTAEAGATEAEAKAKTAQVTAKYADSQAVADLEKKGWDIKALQADIGFKRESNRIAAMNAAFNREGNELKREELRMKIEETKRARDTAVREKAAEASSILDGLGSTQGLIDEIRADPVALKMATGPNALLGSLPGTDARTAAGKLEQLSNVFASMNLDKLKGPTSDRDIAFLKNLGANLDRWQKTGNVLKELKKVEEATQRLAKLARDKYGAPVAGAAAPAGPAAGEPTVSGW